VLLTIDDITQLKTQELRLKELDEAKNKFFSIFAHDLRSPFSALIGLTELLYKELDEVKADVEEAKYYSKQINSLSYDTLILLDNLLEWSKTLLGLTVSKPGEILLSEALHQSLKPLKSIANNKKIAVVINEYEDLKFTADIHLLVTIIRNILSSAIKFSLPESEVNIHINRQNNHVNIAITDHGTGMNEETLKSLFHIDKINPATGTDSEKGTGIGLIICGEYIKKLGGIIDVQSTPGNGSTFTIALPLHNKN